MHDGAKITTIEGLADTRRTSPLQQAFIDEDAFQMRLRTSANHVGVGCIAEGHTGSQQKYESG